MKTYLTIMKEELAKEIIENKKPELSMVDWKFILECLVTLDNISKSMDTVNAELFKYRCELNFEVLEDVTGHFIISEDNNE